MPCSHSPVTRAPILRGKATESYSLGLYDLRELWRQINEVHQNTAQEKKARLSAGTLTGSNLFRLVLVYNRFLSCLQEQSAGSGVEPSMAGKQTADSLRSHRNCFLDPFVWVRGRKL